MPLLLLVLLFPLPVLLLWKILVPYVRVSVIVIGIIRVIAIDAATAIATVTVIVTVTWASGSFTKGSHLSGLGHQVSTDCSGEQKSQIDGQPELH